MADGVDVKMGVSGISQFKSAMSQAQQSVKTLDAALKLNEKQLQATGDKETYMENKSKLLQQQIKAQTAVVKQGEQALSAMEKNGVNPAGQAYQRMQQQVLTAQTSLLGMHDQLSNVGSAAAQTAQKTDDLSASVNSINKKVSFDAVLNGIGRITDGMERAGRRIADFAKDAWSTMAEAASWADEENTLAAMYGLDVETLQRMQGASKTIDTSVEAYVKSRQKLKQSMVSDSEDIKAAFIDLGVQTGNLVQGKYGPVKIMREWEDVFWDTGKALLAFDDDVKKDVIANQLFGKSWMELMPIFQAGREEYEKTLAEQSVVSKENVDKLNQLDDALQKLDQEFGTLKNTVFSELSPAFSDLATSLSGVIHQFNEYLKTDEGKEKMEALGDAVSRLFDSLTDIDAGAAIDTAAKALDSVIGALDWIRKNHGSVVTALKVIGVGFAGLKAAEMAGTLAQGALAMKNLIRKGIPQTQPEPVSQTQPEPVPQTQPEPIPQTQPEPVPQTQPEPVPQQKPVRAPKIKPVKEASLTHQALGTTILETGAFAFAAAVAVDSLLDVTKGVQESLTAGAETMKEYERKSQEYGGDELFNIWDTLTKYSTVAGGPEDRAKIEEFAQHYMQWFNDEITDPTLDRIVNGMSNEGYDKFHDSMIALATGQHFYSTEDQQALFAGIDEAVKTAEQLMQADPIKAPVEPQLPANAGEMIQSALDANTYTIAVTPYMGAQLDTSTFNIDGEHANGLPFVPFDGYIAALHRGERVVPANQNKSYTANSNLYVEKMYMNNAVNAQGLAAAMAAENRRIRAGFGS